MENVKVNVIVGRFQPFTLGHITGAEQIYKEYGLKTVFLIINTLNSKVDSRHPFESVQIIKDNINCGEDWFAGMFSIQSADIGKIAAVCRDNGFEPVMWTCGTDRYAGYSRQASEKYINMYNLSPEFKVNEIKRTDDDISASAVRQALKDGDRKTFEKMMPKWTWNKFDIYKSIVSAVKESKTLSSFIKESLYSNLGLSDDLEREFVLSWCDTYTKMMHDTGRYSGHNNLWLSGTNGYIKLFDNTISDFVIDTNPKHDLTPNGSLPEYITQYINPVNTRSTTIDIYSDPKNPFKNIDSIPSDLLICPAINLYGKYDSIDFNSIDTEMKLSVNADVNIKSISNIKNLSSLSIEGKSIVDIIAVLHSFNSIAFKNGFYYHISVADKRVTGAQIKKYINCMQAIGLFDMSNSSNYSSNAVNKASCAWDWKIRRWIDLSPFDIEDYSFFKYIKSADKMTAVSMVAEKIPEDKLMLLQNDVLLVLYDNTNDCKYTRNNLLYYYSGFSFIDVEPGVGSILIRKKK